MKLNGRILFCLISFIIFPILTLAVIISLLITAMLVSLLYSNLYGEKDLDEFFTNNMQLIPYVVVTIIILTYYIYKLLYILLC